MNHDDGHGTTAYRGGSHAHRKSTRAHRGAVHHPAPRAALIEALDFLRLAQRDWRKPGAYAAVVAAWQFVQEALDALECDERHARAGMRP